ncbi:MAG: hypothetical protein WA180_22125, partial [Candidatus Sulfotelmatobacter sp.]
HKEEIRTSPAVKAARRRYEEKRLARLKQERLLARTRRMELRVSLHKEGAPVRAAAADAQLEERADLSAQRKRERNARYYEAHKEQIRYQQEQYREKKALEGGW